VKEMRRFSLGYFEGEVRVKKIEGESPRKKFCAPWMHEWSEFFVIDTDRLGNDLLAKACGRCGKVRH